eukprot:scaffold107536_cov66-Phaeocystis_antarctica.AAC.1
MACRSRPALGSAGRARLQVGMSPSSAGHPELPSGTFLPVRCRPARRRTSSYRPKMTHNTLRQTYT